MIALQARDHLEKPTKLVAYATARVMILHGKAKANPHSSYNINNIVDGSETIMSDRSPMAIHRIEVIQHLLGVSIWDSPISNLY